MEEFPAGSGRRFDLHDRALVERCLGTPITTLREIPGPRRTSYVVRRLVIELADGRTLDVFHKEFDASPHEQAAALSRGERECFVYEKILPGMGLGTPELYGVVWDDDARRHWLMLEFVDGRHLRLAHERIAAARWLGRLHGRVAGRETTFVGPGPLLNYDSTYFRTTAERALGAVGARFETQRRRLEAALADYEAVIEKTCSGPSTLVHGSFRAKNIIVEGASEPMRICPADWELAAIGPRLHDLAFIADGSERTAIEQLCNAYLAEAAAAGGVATTTDEMLEDIDRLRMHKALRSLARSLQWDYSADVVAKLVARVERLRDGLG